MSVLIGFHSANGWSQVGRAASGTKAVETNVIGKSTVKITCCADLDRRHGHPEQDAEPDIAKANSRSSPTPAISDADPVVSVQPTTNPVTISTKRMPAL